jgi:hypothetical protein
MTDIRIDTKLELVEESAEDKEAFASISLNPGFQWAKIVITDDLPNANKHRIPIEEFDNLAKTGIFAPIKMAEKLISDHKDAMGKPIGTITQIGKFGNKLIALAALWKRERPEEVDLLKKMYLEENPPNVSWELSYEQSTKEEDDVEVFHGVSLHGLAVVSNPAYVGRTPFIAMASTNNQEENVEELEQLKSEVSNLKDEVSKLNQSVQEKEAELDSLRKFKEEKEASEAKEKRLIEIKNKFQEANLEKDEKFWEEKSELLLGLDDVALEFMIQEMVSTLASAEASNKNIKIPNVLKNGSPKNLSPQELGQALRESKLKIGD